MKKSDLEGEDMVLAIDVGNTNIVLGCLDSSNVYFEARLATDHFKTFEQYAVELKNILELYDTDPDSIEGAIISCVVPPLTSAIRKAVELVTGLTPIVVGPGIKTGLKIATDDPGQLGSDLVVGAVAALAQFSPPMVIFDLGTATTASVIDSSGSLLGGIIYPGINISLAALSSRTSQLPRISLEAPSKVIGRNTVDCMNSGMIFGSASMIEGLVSRIESELRYKVTVIMTGGLASLIAQHCQIEVFYDANLMLKGLYILYIKNNKKVK